MTGGLVLCAVVATTTLAGLAPAPPSVASTKVATEKVAPKKLPDGAAIGACEDAPANMACIVGGDFVRGTDDGPENARPRATIAVQTFYMDMFEVTIAEYKACV